MNSLTTGFPAGNIEKWSNVLRTQAPQIASVLFSTVDPLVCACLIDLLGDTTRFRKRSGEITPRMNAQNMPSFDIRLVYSVGDFIGFSGTEEPLIRDQQYILKRLTQIPGIAWAHTAVQIRPSDGSVTITFNIPENYA